MDNENACKYITLQKVITLEVPFYMTVSQGSRHPERLCSSCTTEEQSTVVPAKQGLLSNLSAIRGNFCQPVLHALTLIRSCHADSAPVNAAPGYLFSTSDRQPDATRRLSHSCHCVVSFGCYEEHTSLPSVVLASLLPQEIGRGSWSF